MVKWELAQLPPRLDVVGKRPWWNLVVYVLLHNAANAAAPMGSVRVAVGDDGRDCCYLEITNHWAEPKAGIAERMQEVLRRTHGTMSFGYVGLTTASDALAALAIAREDITVSRDIPGSAIVVKIAGIQKLI
jgi:hypothetical protein